MYPIDPDPGGGGPPPCRQPLTSPTHANSPQPTLAKPAFNTPVLDPVYNQLVVRIVPDSGTAFAATGPGAPGPVSASGVWGRDGRHHYSKDQPWNSDQTLIALQNKAAGGGTGNSEVIVNASDFSMTYYGLCGGGSIKERRWHPTQPFYRVIITSQDTDHADYSTAKDSVIVQDVRTCARIKTGSIPIHAVDIGTNEGNLSYDGCKVLLYTNHYRPTDGATPDSMVVADLCSNPTTVLFGTPYPIPACSLETSKAAEDPDALYPCDVDNGSITALGNYAVLQYHGGSTLTGAASEVANGDTIRHFRVFNVDGTTITGPRVYHPDSLNRMCGVSMLGGTNKRTSAGWVSNIDHVDFGFMYDPQLGQNVEYAMGGRQCGSTWVGFGPATSGGNSRGRIERVNLRTGSSISLSTATDEPSQIHTSARAQRWPGWVIVSYDVNGTRLYDELVAYKMDGSGSLIRYGQVHTDDSYYRGESHMVPSWDGRQVMFSSDWTLNSGGTGASQHVRSYIIDARAACQTRTLTTVQHLPPGPFSSLPAAAPTIYSAEIGSESEMVITNNGNDPLEITGPTNNVFVSVSPFSGTIGPGETHAITLTIIEMPPMDPGKTYATLRFTFSTNEPVDYMNHAFELVVTPTPQ